LRKQNEGRRSRATVGAKKQVLASFKWLMSGGKSG
jgi:hypothetical protein